MGRVSDLLRRAAFLGIVIFAGVQGCVDLRTPKPVAPQPPAIAEQEAENELLGRGDVLEVKVYMEPEMSGVYPVGFDGAILFPPIGKVPVAGRDAQQVADDIRDRLSKGFLVDPQVGVFIRERTAQKIHVWGQVEKVAKGIQDGTIK